jgi:hypothetical protein
VEIKIIEVLMIWPSKDPEVGQLTLLEYTAYEVFSGWGHFLTLPLLSALSFGEGKLKNH